MAYKVLPHIIHQQVFDLYLSDPHVVDHISQRFKNAFHSAIPRIEVLFSQYDDPDHIIRMDKIFLDLGKFENEQIEELFSERLYEALAGAFFISLKNHQAPFAYKRNDHQKFIAQDLYQSSEQIDAEYFTAHEGMRQAFLYFLEYGVFPWWISENNAKDIKTVFTTVLDSPSPIFVSKLKALLSNDKNALMRLAWQFSDHFIDQVLILLEDSARPEILILYRQLKLHERGQHAQPIHYFTVNHVFNLFRLEMLLANDQMKVVGAVMRHLNYLVAEGFDIDNLVKAIARNKTLPWRNEILKGLTMKSDDASIEVFSLAPEKPNNLLFTEISSQSRRQNDKASENDEEAVWEGSMDKSIYVHYAGLVILHPFLPVIFSTLGLLNTKKKFLNERAKSRAVHLLAFLASGKTNPPENTLVFCKFLCGMPLKKAIIKIPSLKTIEVQECTELLQAVITHWETLKNTSVDGLREAFLSRMGKLDFRDAVPVLYIERMTYDILLESLPWGIGFIQLPWLNKPLAITWN